MCPQSGGNMGPAARKRQMGVWEGHRCGLHQPPGCIRSAGPQAAERKATATEAWYIPGVIEAAVTSLGPGRCRECAGRFALGNYSKRGGRWTWRNRY
jgi:hypothetical protein